MKQLGLFLSGILLVGILAACAGGGDSSAPAESGEPATSESLSSEDPEPFSAPGPPESPTVPDPEPESAPAAPASPAPVSPYTFALVDSSGKPVANVAGSLFLSVLEEWEESGESWTQERGDGELPAPLVATNGDPYSGADGKLHLTDRQTVEWIQAGDPPLDRGELGLVAHYNDRLRQTVIVDLTDPPKEITVVWQGSPPPTSRPERLYFHITDEAGNPVEALFADLNKGHRQRRRLDPG